MKKIIVALSLIALMGAGCSNASAPSPQASTIKTITPTQINGQQVEEAQVKTSLQVNSK